MIKDQRLQRESIISINNDKTIEVVKGYSEIQNSKVVSEIEKT